MHVHSHARCMHILHHCVEARQHSSNTISAGHWMALACCCRKPARRLSMHAGAVCPSMERSGDTSSRTKFGHNHAKPQPPGGMMQGSPGSNLNLKPIEPKLTGLARQYEGVGDLVVHHCDGPAPAKTVWNTRLKLVSICLSHKQGALHKPGRQHACCRPVLQPCLIDSWISPWISQKLDNLLGPNCEVWGFWIRARMPRQARRMRDSTHAHAASGCVHVRHAALRRVQMDAGCHASAQPGTGGSVGTDMAVTAHAVHPSSESDSSRL